jgi:hypothetical protein
MRPLNIISTYLAASILLMQGCEAQRYSPGGILASSLDPSSFGNVDVIFTKNVFLNVTVDFDQRKLIGYVDLTMQAIQYTSEVVLDYQGIDL